MSFTLTHRPVRTLRTLALGLVVGLVALAGVVAPVAVPSAHAALGAGGEYLPVTPSRVFDSRLSVGALQFGAETFVQITNANSVFGVPSGIPASNVLAVLATITIAGPTKGGYLTAYPKGVATPDASNLNFQSGRDMSNLALLRPGADGQVAIKLDGATNASAQVIVDVVGWFSTSSGATRGARLISVEPGRILDTRNGLARSGAVGAAEQFKLPIRGADSNQRADYVPADASITGVLMNLTVVSGSSPTFVSVQPDAFAGFPTTSSVNLRANEVKANLVAVPVGADGTISLFNERGSSHIIADVVGYFRSGINDETRSGRIVPLSAPFRIMDTRQGTSARPLGNDEWETWDLDDDSGTNTSFVDSVKLDGVWVGDISAVLMNFTLAGAACPCFPSGARDTFMYVFPDPEDSAYDPDNRSSNINKVMGGDAIANFTVTRLSVQDKIGVYNKAGQVNYLGDVAAVVLE